MMTPTNCHSDDRIVGVTRSLTMLCDVYDGLPNSELELVFFISNNTGLFSRFIIKSYVFMRVLRSGSGSSKS